MRPNELEAWTLRVAHGVQSARRLEGARVELKADWPEAAKAARRIGGHANASRDEPILWIVGLDETGAPRKIAHQESSSWWPQVQTQFEGVSPSLTHIIVPYQGHHLASLLFDTSRAPFVVKNPVHGHWRPAVAGRAGEAGMNKESAKPAAEIRRAAKALGVKLPDPDEFVELMRRVRKKRG